MTQTYVVTGGGGFIGSNIARELVKQGHTVKVVDNFSTGKKENLKDIVDDVEVIEGSITELPLLEKAFAGATYVLHQAALPSVPRSVADPIASNEANITGTLNVLVAARNAQVKRVVYAASSSAYGNAEVEFKSEDLPANPLSPYAFTKYAGEVYCRQFYTLYGLETVALRYFNVFGPYQNPNGDYAAVIPKFILTMLRGEAPTINGDGTQSRDFTYVANNVRANILAATATKGAGEVMNIACGTSTSLNDLVDIINEELNTAIKPSYREARLGDIKHSKAAVDKAQKLIGYAVETDFATGLKETIQWYKKNSP